MKELQRGTKVIDRFSKSETFGRVAIILEQDQDGDYWCFFPNCALGYNLKDEEYDILDELGVDEFGTCGYCFPEMVEVVAEQEELLLFFFAHGSKWLRSYQLMLMLASDLLQLSMLISSWLPWVPMAPPIALAIFAFFCKNWYHFGGSLI